jgi:hypothetical protein
MNKLNDFWKINWIENTPDIFVVGNRKQINLLQGKETSGELVGWAKNRNIYILDFQKIETESSYKLTPEQYVALIKHELNHLFYGIVSDGAMGPLWLREGLSICLSGQTKNGQWQKPAEFKGFIDSEGKNKKYAYAEGGFVVELLINKFGKDKVVQFVKEMKGVNSEEEVGVKFKEVFGIDLTYEALNDLYTK